MASLSLARGKTKRIPYDEKGVVLCPKVDERAFFGRQKNSRIAELAYGGSVVAVKIGVMEYPKPLGLAKCH